METLEKKSDYHPPLPRRSGPPPPFDEILATPLRSGDIYNHPRTNGEVNLTVTEFEINPRVFSNLTELLRQIKKQVKKVKSTSPLLFIFQRT